jgi:hypothetical protein
VFYAETVTPQTSVSARRKSQMTHSSPAAGPTARRAGAAYLLLIAAGIFAEFFVRSQLVVPGEVWAT